MEVPVEIQRSPERSIAAKDSAFSSINGLTAAALYRVLAPEEGG